MTKRAKNVVNKRLEDRQKSPRHYNVVTRRTGKQLLFTPLAIRRYPEPILLAMVAFWVYPETTLTPSRTSQKPPPKKRKAATKKARRGSPLAIDRRKRDIIDRYYGKLESIATIRAALNLQFHTVKAVIVQEAGRLRAELEDDGQGGQSRMKDKIVANLERLLDQSIEKSLGTVDGPAWARVQLACMDRLARLYGLNPDMTIRVNIGPAQQERELVPLAESPAGRRVLELFHHAGIALPGSVEPNEMIVDAEIVAESRVSV